MYTNIIISCYLNRISAKSFPKKNKVKKYVFEVKSFHQHQRNLDCFEEPKNDSLSDELVTFNQTLSTRERFKGKNNILQTEIFFKFYTFLKICYQLFLYCFYGSVATGRHKRSCRITFFHSNKSVTKQVTRLILSPRKNSNNNKDFLSQWLRGL